MDEDKYVMGGLRRCFHSTERQDCTCALEEVEDEQEEPEE